MSKALRISIGLAALAGLLLFISQVAEIPFRSARCGYDNTFNYRVGTRAPAD